MNALDTVLHRLVGRLEWDRALGGAVPTATREALGELLATRAARPPVGSAAEAPETRPAAKPPIVSRVREAVAAASAGPGPATEPIEFDEADPRPREVRLAELRERVAACAKCPALAAFRTQTVFGVGDPEAELMFVGEAPGFDEDEQGEPFVGKAGQLLTKIIGAMGLTRGQVYIANVLKCRPDMPAGESGNRRPTPAEMATCLPYLRAQIQIIRPKAIVALGAVALEGLFGVKMPVGAARGRWHEWGGIPVMPTFHPAYLLRNQTLVEKRKVWDDMLAVLQKLGHPISEKQRQYFREP